MPPNLAKSSTIRDSVLCFECPGEVADVEFSVPDVHRDDVEAALLIGSAVKMQKMTRRAPDFVLLPGAYAAFGCAFVALPDGFDFHEKETPFRRFRDDVEFASAVRVIAGDEGAALPHQEPAGVEFRETSLRTVIDERIICAHRSLLGCRIALFGEKSQNAEFGYGDVARRVHDVFRVKINLYFRGLDRFHRRILHAFEVFQLDALAVAFAGLQIERLGLVERAEAGADLVIDGLLIADGEPESGHDRGLFKIQSEDRVAVISGNGGEPCGPDVFIG